MSDSPNNCATKTGPSCWHTHTYREREERENARARERVFSVFPSENVSRRALVAHATARIKWNENPARKSHIGWGRRFGKQPPGPGGDCGSGACKGNGAAGALRWRAGLALVHASRALSLAR